VQIVNFVKPTLLISCTSSPRAVQPITEAAVRSMSRNTARPIIFALSSPTSELSAAQAYHWSDGRAMYANFEGPQEEVVTPEGQILTPSKVQSVYVFPGVALGTCVTRCASKSGMHVCGPLCRARQGMTRCWQYLWRI
jgi:malic enzyme